MNTPIDYSFERHGRSWGALAAVAITWAFCALLALVLEASIWIWGVVLLLSLPALWEFFQRSTAGTQLTPTTLSWHTGDRNAEIALREIDHIRFVTRLDFSVRAAVVLKSGRKLRIPAESTPPYEPFDAALHALDTKTERHHFTFL